MIRIADDGKPDASMTQDQVVNLSRQASGTGHPAVLSISSEAVRTGSQRSPITTGRFIQRWAVRISTSFSSGKWKPEP